MRINFFGDSVWAANTLERLLRDGHEIPLVVRRRDPTDSVLTDVASEYDLEICAPRDVNTREFVERVEATSVHLNVSVSFDQIIGPELRDASEHGFINCHAGRLPNYRGRNVVNWAIINDERQIGVTVHYMDDGIDTGPILRQTTVPLEWTDTYGSIMERIYETIPRVVSEAISDIEEGDVSLRRQDPRRGTYYPNRGPGDEWLDWRQTSRRLYNFIRSITHPGPGARTVCEGRTLLIWSAKYNPDWPNYSATPGAVVGRQTGGVRVKTGDSTILLESVQFIDEDVEFTPEFSIGTRLGLDPVREVIRLRREVDELRRKLESGSKE